MHTSSFSLLRAAGAVALFGFLLVLQSTGAEAPKVMFDVPAGDARPMLREFAAQSKREIVFPVELVAAVKTNAVKGEMLVRKALDTMLAGTGLVASQDAKTGAFAVRRDESPNAPRAAQTVTSARPMAKNDNGAIELDAFQVHGVREPGPVNQGVIPRTADGAMPFQLFDRQTIDRSGAMTLSEFFRNVSSNTSAGLGYQNTFAAAPQLLAPGPADAADRINLRGLGSSRTVVLLNGRRLYGSDTAGPDISRIPLSSVDRIEILGGASAAIYGANAAGGVVNIITRKNFNGGEVSLYGGTTTAGGGNEWHATVFYGFSGNDGRTSGTISFEHVDRGAVMGAQRRFYDRAIARVPVTSPVFFTALINLIGGSRGVAFSATGLGIPGNPTATFATVPAGYNPTTPAAADFTATAGQALLDTTKLGRTLLQSPARVDSFNAQAEHKLIPGRLEAYIELAWRYQDGSTTTPGVGPLGNSIAATNPFNPFDKAVNLHYFPIELPSDPLYSIQRTVRAVGGLKGKFGGERKWAWALDYSYDQNETYVDYTQNTVAVGAAVNLGLYNPFRDRAGFPNAITLSDYQRRYTVDQRPEIFSGNLRVSGQLWEWAGGRINLSAGAEARQEKFSVSQTGGYGSITVASLGSFLPILLANDNGKRNSSRRAEAGYAELAVPLVGAGNRLPFLEALELDFAVRRESYGSYRFDSTFGTTGGVHSGSVAPDNIKGTPITLAAKWQPVRDVTFRASYGGTFVSPSMTALFNARTTVPTGTLTYFDPVLGTTVTAPTGAVTQTRGGNPFLRSETGRTYSYGAIVTPRWLPQLSLSLDYFKSISQDRVATPNVQTVLNFFPERVTRDPATKAVTAIDISQVNTALVVTSGLDATLSWKQPTESLGVFTLTTNATYIDLFKLRPIAGAVLQKGVADKSIDGNAPLRLKGNTSLFWTRNSLTVGATVRYLGNYKDSYNTGLQGTNFPPRADFVDGAYIGSSTEFDVQAAYQFTDKHDGWARWLNRTKVTLGVRNLLDRAPPYDTGSPAFYSLYNDPRQRYVYLELKRAF